MRDRNDLFDDLKLITDEQSCEAVCNLNDNEILTEEGQITSQDEIKNIRIDIDNLRNDFQDLKNIMKDQYSKLNIILDKIFSILNNESTPTTIKTKEISSTNVLSKFTFPLSSCNEIYNLNEELRDDEFRKQLVEFLSQIGGSTGHEDGFKIAYRIVDYLFDRSVLINYSWTGISRDKSQMKKPLQILEGILDLFYAVVSLADNRYTRKKNNTFFKDAVLKHAKKRSCRKRNQSLLNEKIHILPPVEETATSTI